jgi:hypothetical protein
VATAKEENLRNPHTSIVELLRDLDQKILIFVKKILYI